MTKGRGALGVVIPAIVAVLLAGCGSSSNPGVAHLASSKGSSGSGASSESSSTSNPKNQAEAERDEQAFTRCMRSHGVPAFPEQHEGHITIQGGPGDSGLNPKSSQFQSAQSYCQKLLPNGGQPTPEQKAAMQERALKFSACMRSHGVPKFPSPNFEGGGVELTLKAGSGLDPRSPQFQAAQKACSQYFGPPGSKGTALAAPPSGGPGGSASGQTLVVP